MATKSEVATTDGKSVAKMSDDALVFERFLAAAEGGELDVDADDVTLDIVRRILSASSAAEVLDRVEPIHARDYLDRPFALKSVKFNESDFDSDAGKFYAVMDGFDDGGDPITVLCGAKQVIAQAWRLQDLDALPIKVKIMESTRTTKSGYKVMWLESLPPDF